MVVTVVTGPQPSTPDPCYRQAQAAGLITGGRADDRDSHWSAARQSAAAGWSPI